MRAGAASRVAERVACGAQAPYGALRRACGLAEHERRPRPILTDRTSDIRRGRRRRALLHEIGQREREARGAGAGPSAAGAAGAGAAALDVWGGVGDGLRGARAADVKAMLVGFVV